MRTTQRLKCTIPLKLQREPMTQHESSQEEMILPYTAAGTPPELDVHWQDRAHTGWLNVGFVYAVGRDR